MSMFDIFKTNRTTPLTVTWLMEQLTSAFQSLGDRLGSIDSEIDALQTSKAEMLQDIERLKAQVKLIEHELAIVQRKSLAQKLREKGVVK